MTTPSMEYSALLAQGSYKMGEREGSKQDRIALTNAHVQETGYVVNNKHTNFDLTTYQHKDDPNNVFISHRGTKLDGRGAQEDARADFGILTGRAGSYAKFDRQKRKTNQAIKDLNPTSLYMGSHSLGGSTQNYTIANSKTVRKHLTGAKSFNAGANPTLTNSMSVTPKIREELKNKVEHHRIKNDPISMGYLTGNVPFGKLKQHTVDFDGSKDKSLFQNVLENTTSWGRSKLMTEKGFHAHGISHFHSGAIRKRTKSKRKKMKKIKK